MPAPEFNKADIKSRILSFVPVGVTVVEARQRNMKTEFGTVFDVVYLYRETMTKKSDGGTSGRVIRQIYDGHLEIVIVAQKFVNGQNTQLARIKELKDAVFNAMFGYSPPGNFTAFDLANSADGDPADMVSYCVQRWHAEVIQQESLIP